MRTFFEEWVMSASDVPDVDTFAFGWDEDANERVQLFRLDADRTATLLTALPDARHRWDG